MPLTESSVMSDVWLESVLERRSYKLELSADTVSSAAADLAALIDHSGRAPLFVYAKIDADFIAGILLAARLGFRLVDTNVLFSKPIGGGAVLPRRCQVRWANAADEQAIGELARHFTYTRFHMDPAFSKTVADEVKVQWCHSFFSGGRGDAMVVATVDQVVAGFLLLLHGPADSLTIDLVAVDPSQRRRGLAKAMIAFAEQQGGAFSSMRVGTQLANIPSISLYESLGFRLLQSRYVFHYHHPSNDRP